MSAEPPDLPPGVSLDQVNNVPIGRFTIRGGVIQRDPDDDEEFNDDRFEPREPDFD